MVQLKYFGDNRDYFKYDLITHLLSKDLLTNYSFVPMLTDHRDDSEGNIKPLNSSCKSDELLLFINHQQSKNLNHWEIWLKRHASEYCVMQPVNELFFSNSDRDNYWASQSPVINKENALVFFDPDTGFQAGRKTAIKVADREKYILDTDLDYLITAMDDSSAFMVYQHLQFNAKKREEDVDNKLSTLMAINDSIHVSAYREKDLAFIFIAKDSDVHDNIVSALNEYSIKSSILPRSVHLKTAHE